MKKLVVIAPLLFLVVRCAIAGTRQLCGFASCLTLIVLLCLPGNVTAADVRALIHNTGSYRAIIIEGEIEQGDFDKFIKIVRDNQGLICCVSIFSPGGDFNEAMKIGRAMRALELSSMVPMRDPSGKAFCEDDDVLGQPKEPKNCTCASAGFFIHIGAVHRGGTFVAVHRPYLDKAQFSKLSQDQAKKEFESLQKRARDYMQEMGVPKHIQEEILGIPSDRALVLDEKTVKTYFWGDLPYRHEWLEAKCSRMSDQERLRWENYGQKLNAVNWNLERLSAQEAADFQMLGQKKQEESNCEIPLLKQSRIDAYEKYFRIKPTDYANHNFAKWGEAPKYLGRSLEDILGEERFDKKEDKFAGKTFTSLERPATATAPSILLFDSPSRPGVVTDVTLISSPEPSKEFIERLKKSLIEAWGKPSGGNGSSEWVWEKNGYKAGLKYNPVASDGPFLSLKIEARP